MLISIIHPSRQRPAESQACIDKWIRRAGMDVELIVSVDINDPTLQDYRNIYDNPNGPFRGLAIPPKLLINNNRSAVDAVNQGAQHAAGDVFIVVSDDFMCPQNWALVLEKHLKLRRDYLFKVNDGTQLYIVTLPIMDRTYYNRFGYIYHPDYLHMFCDTHLTHVADILRRLIIKNDLLFQHNHYSVVKKKKDEVSERADKTWDEGKRIYLSHVKNKFGLGRDADIWQLSPEGQAHREWLKRNGA